MDALIICAVDRVQLAAAVTEELVSLGHDHSWLWLAPDEDTATIHGVRDFLAAFRTPPTDLDGWERATRIGVKLAGYNEAEDRRDRFAQAAFASGMQPHGGLKDTVLRDALQLIGARPPRQLAASM